MESIADVVKRLVPGSMGFLLLGVTFGVALLYSKRLARWGRRWLVLLVVVYVALSIPVVGRWLEGGLHPDYPPLDRPAAARGARTIVVLGNGAVTYGFGAYQVHSLTRRTAMNVIEGARLYQLLRASTVIVSGGAAYGATDEQSEAALMAEEITRLGVPRSSLVVEPRSQNTYQQSVRVAALVSKDPRIVLVTTPIHMARAVSLFEARGVRTTPAPSPIEYMPHPLTWSQRLVPNAGALRMSELSIYERLANVLGWARKWSAADQVPQ